ncbi:ABC transporter ATP-binding protein [Arthrobacter mobilis]|uniref:ATP-binding cassette domain-containing protein n=1 Tax=Arthrobacter mobilis TaxID=2724944 RepID=A0A7X6H9U1_9MICC|nr:ATP-binding cassette domain-containing protein [Arthrobacter mobilis]NKX53126.1 ATP-binding cassette domain-containing protein [Arthrobacter mobilis]
MNQGLAVRNLDVDRGGLRICRDVSLTVRPGQVSVLLGANGAGKSSLLDGITGVVATSKGTIELDGQPLHNRRRPHRARMGLSYVEQGRAVFSQLSVEENILIVGGPQGARDAFELFPRLAERRSLSAGLLSGGEQQMLLVARAMAMKPKVLLLDELSLGLAPVIVQTLLATVRKLADEGLAVLLVEQFAALALAIGDSAYVLNRGQIVFNGSCEQLKADPAVLEAAYLSV